MGTGSEYFYGPVTDYSLKSNMGGGGTGRGWTWGVTGLTPVTAINVLGNMQIAGSFTTGGDIILPSINGNKQIYTWSQGDANWRIGMSASPGFTRSIATQHTEYLTYSNGAGQGFAIGVNGGSSSLEILGSDHRAFFRGNVGIGTTTTGSFKLAVEGKIGAREVNVTTNAWADYVFDADYALSSLESLKVFINKNKHLPEIPTAQEVETNGINLGEMNTLLLKKVEELTLYMITLKEENESLKIEVQKINARLNDK